MAESFRVAWHSYRTLRQTRTNRSSWSLPPSEKRGIFWRVLLVAREHEGDARGVRRPDVTAGLCACSTTSDKRVTFRSAPFSALAHRVPLSSPTLVAVWYKPTYKPSISNLLYRSSCTSNSNQQNCNNQPRRYFCTVRSNQRRAAAAPLRHCWQ